jgi:hypothetical protein
MRAVTTAPMIIRVQAYRIRVLEALADRSLTLVAVSLVAASPHL